MPNYIFTLQQRLAGNLYENRYYINGTDVADGIAKAQSIINGQAQIQTIDVEYVGALLTLVEGAHTTTPFIPVHNSGQNAGSTVTLPGGVFLEFLFFPRVGKGKVTHRIRGCASSSETELSVFSTESSGVGDDDGGVGLPAATTVYGAYSSSVALNSTDPNGNPVDKGTRVSVGFKRAGRAL